MPPGPVRIRKASRSSFISISLVPIIPHEQPPPPDPTISSTYALVTMVTRHRQRSIRQHTILKPAQLREIPLHDLRRPYSNRAGLPQRGIGRGRARRRRPGIRPRPVQIHHLRRIQQVPASSLVGRAQYGAPRARGRGKEWDTSPRGAAIGPVAPRPAGDLPRARSPYAVGQKGSKKRLSAKAAPHSGSALSELR